MIRVCEIGLLCTTRRVIAKHAKSDVLEAETVDFDITFVYILG